MSGSGESPIVDDIERCDAEIAKCLEYLRSGESAQMAGAYLGIADWRTEKMVILEECGIVGVDAEYKLQGMRTSILPVPIPDAKKWASVLLNGMRRKI